MAFLPLFEWCIVVLITFVAARMFPPRMGFVIAFLGAVGWLCLSLVTPWAVDGNWRTIFLLAGSTSIVLIGLWLYDSTTITIKAVKPSRPARDLFETITEEKAEPVQDLRNSSDSRKRDDAVSKTRTCITEFSDWLARFENDRNPWPHFDEFLRGILQIHCGARQIRFFRLVENEKLEPLNERKDDEQGSRSAREGILGHVCTTGKPYLAMDPATGQYLRELAAKTSSSPAWVFPIMRGAGCIGAVWAGKLIRKEKNETDYLNWLELIASLTTRFWLEVDDTCRLQQISEADPSTGVLSCESFMTEAETALAECYTRNEPVVLAVIAVEGLRSLGDSGAWDKVRTIISNIAQIAGQKCRTHDLLGRFDDSRFLLFLRRVDSELAMLIINQLMDAMNETTTEPDGRPQVVTYRCGVAGSGFSKPELNELIHRAAEKCHEARRQQIPLASDLQPEDAV